ncbi:peptidase [Streptacidiphilus sp. EB129]|uniref:peptidase n=1 Tax=Streptacidiphilus sp. EB129 TaxID=3156262 RepID=UPI003510F43E
MVPLLIAVLFTGVGAAPAGAHGAGGHGAAPAAGIGIKLLEAPVSRRDDPRAHTYIVDHLAPGSVIKRRVEVTNESATLRHIDLYAAAASIDDNAFAFAPEHTPNELSTWTSLDRTGVDVPAWGSSPVQVSLHVPNDASTGERYAVIWAQGAVAPDQSHSVTLVNRVGVRMYIDVGPGGEPPSDFRIDKVTPARTRDGRPELWAQVRNTGGRAVDLSGTLSLSGGPGGLRAGPFTAETGTTLLPGGHAPVTVLLDKQLPDGPWAVDLTLKSGLVVREVNAVVTFPHTPGATGNAVELGLARWRTRLALAAVAALVLAGVAGYQFRRVRQRA